ncbi:hypothetical protein J8F10_14390 [Gemmata sp. G18]|uniref:Uncharacterized protein n=1 Tax=Gemmata palustris TaxID=2822762 RepID=A0ABS5BRX3_9BACT|nr:hypothetical protein [Gemmata palustris]MBP3956466.1 hypothetical protein [Gemmata palustris]
MSVLNDILDAVVADHKAAKLKIGTECLRVVKRKLPKKEEGVDDHFQVTISAAEQADQIVRIAFGNVFKVGYRVEMTLITPNDRDQLTNIDTIAAWREATRARYMKPNPIAVSAVKQVEIIDSLFLDRSTLADGYDFDQIALQIYTFERRS